MKRVEQALKEGKHVLLMGKHTVQTSDIEAAREFIKGEEINGNTVCYVFTDNPGIGMVKHD